MGLLDSVLGGVLGRGAPPAGNGPDLAALLPVLASLLANNGQAGGLGGLLDKFNQAGLGPVLASWIGKGENLPISAEQLRHVLGSDDLAQIASPLGLDPVQASAQLSELLPDVVNQLTPQGAAPDGGFGDAGELLGMLGGLLKR